MLLLTSVNDRLQIVTNSAATINVHASWVDTSTGTITPGRTNTAISTAATTNVAGAPGASTQRNVKTLHVRNTHATLACDVTVQHTDGTIVAQLYKVTLSAGDMLEYTDQAGFGGGRAPPPVAASTIPKIVKFTASGTYTPTVGLTYAIVECVGGGGGGGGAGSNANQYMNGGGGGSGGYSRSIVSATTIGVSQTIAIGAGGTGGIGGTGAAGIIGGDTLFGSLIIAKGGSGGTTAVPSTGATGVGGAGGISGTGDIAAAGSPGGQGLYNNGTAGGTFQPGGEGGSSFFGGGATSVFPPGSGPIVAGTGAFNYGSGGGGAYSGPASGAVNGGAGSAGIVIVTEYFN